MTIRLRGRIAGLVYLGLILTGVFSLAYAPRELILPTDPAATLTNIQDQYTLFIAMIAFGVAMAGFFLVLPFALAKVLSVYGKNIARLMILLVVTSIPFTLLGFWEYGDLALAVANDAASVEDTEAAWVGYRHWIAVSTFFWGAWLAPYGWLVIKSGSIPRFLGVMLLAGSVGYLTDLFAPMFLTGFDEMLIADYIKLPASIGEIGSCLWLVAFGARGTDR